MNWPIKKLGEVCAIKKGKKPNLFDMQTESRLPYLGAKFLRGTEESKFAEKSDRNSVPVREDDLIIICDGSKSGDLFSGFKGVLSSTMGRIDFDKKTINKEYLEFFLRDNFELFNSKKKGAAIPHLDFYGFNNLEIPFPPLSEQKRIVKRIEELFAKIDEAEKLREESKKDAEALIPATLHKIFTEGKKKGWEMKKIGDKEILTITSGGTPSRSNKLYYKGNIPWLKSGELEDNQNIIEAMEHISEEAIKKSSAKLFPKDTILFAMYGATAGKLGILGFPAATNQAVAGLICNSDVLYYRFLFFCLLHIRNEIISKAWGGAQPNLSQTIIKNFEIPLPPLSEQKKIVAELDALSEKVRKIEELQKQTAQDFKSLRQSILHQAFSGKL